MDQEINLPKPPKIIEEKPRHEHKFLHFPKGFLWGAATSAHQVEGGNINSDWWDWEQTHQPKDKQSGLADDQYHLYESDFKLLKILGHNAHRLSIEWARIEPDEGTFSQDVIDHYKDELKSLKDKGLVVMLTLHHFTNPLWFAKKGGWTNRKAAYYFQRYLAKIVPEIKDYVDLWITINEPNVLVWGGYFQAIWPPQQKSLYKAIKATWSLVKAHKAGYKLIHQLVPHAKVGIAYNASSYNVIHNHNLWEQIAQWLLDLAGNHFYFFLTGKTHDFLGINYYQNDYIDLENKAKSPKLFDVRVAKKEVSDLGWEIYPQGMFEVLMDYSDYNLPIYITENGIASTNDDRRVRFLIGYLSEVYHAIQAGVDIRGYFHWSLIDNFEWSEGFGPRFGLVDVDYTTQKRTPRPSAFVYKDIISQNGIAHHLLKLLGHTVKVEDVVDVKSLNKQ